MFEEGLNSAWLLPNRLYEGGIYGSVPIAAASMETAHYLNRLGIGLIIPEPKNKVLSDFFRQLTPKQYSVMEDAVLTIPQAQWSYSKQDCKDLVEYLGSLAL